MVITYVLVLINSKVFSLLYNKQRVIRERSPGLCRVVPVFLPMLQRLLILEFEGFIAIHIKKNLSPCELP